LSSIKDISFKTYYNTESYSRVVDGLESFMLFTSKALLLFSVLELT